MTTVLIVGAGSAIAEACARRFAERGDRIFLAGRSTRQLEIVAADLRVRGAGWVGVGALDVCIDADQDTLLDQAWQHLHDVDITLIAHGTLPDQARCIADPAYAMSQFKVNATATIALMGRVARRMRERRAGSIAVISSVAGDRGRASNYLYGSAKAAVSTYASGLRQDLARDGVNVLTIKPGFVDTPMTRDFKKGALWATPDQVAKGIVAAINSRRAVVYLPKFWFAIMQVIVHIPEFVFRRLRF